MFELFCRYWNSYQVGEINGVLLTNTETPDQLEPEARWFWLPLTTSPTNQKNVHKLIMTSLNHYYNHYSLTSPNLDTQFWGHYPTMTLFAWQSNKAILFYFTPNSVSKLIWYLGTEAGFGFISKNLNSDSKFLSFSTLECDLILEIRPLQMSLAKMRSCWSKVGS